MAKTRAQTIQGLELQITQLQEGDAKHEERLAKLEKQFGALVNGSDLKFKAPLLAKIKNVVRDSHVMDHTDAMNTHKEDSVEVWGESEIDPWKYMHSESLVLGRGCMALDKKAIEKQLWNQQLEADQHPIVHRMHYAGHVAAPAHQVEGIFVKESGVYKKQPLHPAPYRNGFWLSLDGVSREDAHVAREAAQEAAADPVAQRVSRQNVAGTGSDAQAVDWLGQIKHGKMIDQQPPAVTGFVMPKWMY